MIRKIINIDEEKCNGCGICANACHEGAIRIINNKAKLISDDYCDGFGDCLPTCPTGAISFIEREALPYNEAKVLANKQAKTLPCGCPSTQEETISHPVLTKNIQLNQDSCLSQWPVQIKLVSPDAPFLKEARLLIAADCTAYAYANFHEKFIKNHITLIGCPKLDFIDYADKLTQILKINEIKSLKIVRMEVPCCKGLEMAVKTAIQNSCKIIPWSVVVISKNGGIVEEN